MWWVQRDASGEIVDAAPSRTNAFQHEVPDDDPGLAAFRLALAVELKRLEVDEHLGAMLGAGLSYTYGGVTKVIQADQVSQGRMDSVQVKINAGLALPSGFAWRAADDTFLPPFASAADFTAMADAVWGWVYANLGVSWRHKDAIATMTDLASVEAYDITAGWTT